MSQEEKPKLIIDEDWKTQVEKEREALKRQEAESGEAVAPTPAVSDEKSVSHQATDDNLPPPPPASFPMLVSMLGTQALAAMGQLGDEAGAPTQRLDYAKHYIDMLDLIERKTKGNLEPQEYDLLADWLHQLRMTYVAVAKK